ncbi:MAG: hypothetical protein M3094_08220 [Actinomycetia bacterium]|nr:hypothetical protein [Actinomycetes bacterium]
MRGAETRTGIRVRRLPDGSLVVNDRAGGEIQLDPAEVSGLIGALMDYEADGGDWAGAQRAGAT